MRCSRLRQAPITCRTFACVEQGAGCSELSDKTKVELKRSLWREHVSLLTQENEWCLANAQAAE